MLFAIVVCAGLVAVSPPAQEVSGGDVATYERAKTNVGRDADAHVKLALWCEAHGLEAERIKHLALAVMIDPKHATARGLMGLVAYRGRWQQPSVVAEKVKADEALAAALAEYNGRRERTPNTAEAQWKLGLWCEGKGLEGEAQAHFATVIRLEPARVAAWKRLGYKKENGRWVTEAQVAADKAEAEAQKQSDQHWKPLLAKWRAWLGEKAKRADAEQALGKVTDPRAVPVVWALFANGDTARQAMAVQVLGQIDSGGASRGLALLAVSSKSPEIRRRATETLKRRDPREFAGLLVALLRDPIKFDVRPVGGPGSPGALFVAGKQFNVQRLYTPAATPAVPILPTDWLTVDANGLPLVMRYQMPHVVDEATWFLPESEALRRARADIVRPMLPEVGESAASGVKPFVQAYDQAAVAANQQHVQALEQRIHQQIAWEMAVAPKENRMNPQRTQVLVDSVHKQFPGIPMAPVSTSSTFTVNEHRNAFVQVQTAIPVGQMALEAQQSAMVAQQQLQSDVATVERYNKQIGTSNERVAQVLNQATGQDLTADPKPWKDWWVNQLGYRSNTAPAAPPVPTFVENVPPNYVPQTVPYTFQTVTEAPINDFRAISCFGAGTLVRTLSGSLRIEALHVGDMVLTQSLKTGALDYHPVLVVHHNPPSPTFKIKVAGETIVSSPFHRFWKAGQGWVMARDLKPGDALRLLDGLSAVASVESSPVQPVFNLDIAGDHDFFVGSGGVLVHDNTLPDLRQNPFDAEPSLTALVHSAR